MIFRQRFLDYFRLRSGNLQDLIGKFENGHFARITEVYRLMVIADSEAEDPVEVGSEPEFVPLSLSYLTNWWPRLFQSTGPCNDI